MLNFDLFLVKKAYHLELCGRIDDIGNILVFHLVEILSELANRDGPAIIL